MIRQVRQLDKSRFYVVQVSNCVLSERCDFMKLPNGFGSVYKLSGNRRNPWCARKTTGFTFDEEKQKSYPIYQFIGYYPTRKEALTALSDYNKDPYDLHHDTITFAEVYDKWSEEHFPKIVNTNGYKAAYKICTDLKYMTFKDIKLDHLQKCVNSSGKNEPTLKTLKNMFCLMWDYAVIHEIVPKDKRDMISYVDISSAGNPNALPRQPFNHQQIDTLWKKKDQEQYSIVLIMIYTGCRIGELLDLKKEDVHLDEKYMFIQKAKTKSGIREVPIADKIIPLFEYWMKRKSEYLFCNTNTGTKISYSTFLQKYWTPLMNDLGYQHKPHDTRHTCVSLLTEAEVDKRIIKQIVGHKGEDVTDHYTHINLTVKLESINKI